MDQEKDGRSTVQLFLPETVNVDGTTISDKSQGSKSDIWTLAETELLMEKFETYLSLVGHCGTFKTKRLMWERISQDMKDNFDIDRSGQQCENRYKTVMKRKKQKPISNKHTSELHEFTALSDDSVEPEVILLDYTSSTSEPAKCIRLKNDKLQVLLDIHRQKEENRERRHKERMEALKELDTEAKMKRTNLPCNYVRKKRRSGSSTIANITLPYYESLSICDPTVKHRKSEGSVPNYPQELLIVESEDDTRDSTRSSNNSNYEDNDTDSVMPAVSVNKSVSPKKFKLDTSNAGLDEVHLKHVERRSAKDNNTEEDDDPDLMFLRSLLPTMKTLGTIESLEFKGEVIQLLKQKLQS